MFPQSFLPKRKPEPGKSFNNLQKSTRKRSDLYHKHTFDVEITPTTNTGLTQISTANGDFVVLSCTAPGRQIGTEEKAIWGPVYNVPSERIYSGDFEMTCHYNKALHNYVNKWMNFIKNPDAVATNDRVQYYDDIIGRIEVTMYNASLTNTTVYKLYECFPLTLSGVELNAGSQNELQTLSISWSFRDFDIITD